MVAPLLNGSTDFYEIFYVYLVGMRLGCKVYLRHHRCPLLNHEQQIIYDRNMLAVSAGQGGFFLVTRNISHFANSCRNMIKKWHRIESCIIWHCSNFIGKTAHLAFKLNIQNNPNAVCNI